MSLKIGRIAYLNVAPYFHYLSQCGFAGEIIYGVPAELNAMLADGTIDACPSSSFEYAVNAEKYLLLPDHSISSVGPVHSVLLFSPGPINEITGQSIAITGESATSINLLRIILSEFCHVTDFSFVNPESGVEQCIQEGQPVLLIGDRALRAAANLSEHCQIFDLGALWYHFTGMPFVFALWILRRDAVKESPGSFTDLVEKLQASKQRAFANLEHMAADLADPKMFTPNQLTDYWRGISYDLTAGHLEGLKLYFYLCHKYGLLDEIPEFSFFSADSIDVSASSLVESV